MAVRRRDHLLAVAQRMFCETGFHAVTVDEILEEAGVARMTLYKNFGSKEDLIVATLEREDRMFREWLVSAVERHALHPQDRIMALFHASTIAFLQRVIVGARASGPALSFLQRSTLFIARQGLRLLGIAQGQFVGQKIMAQLKKQKVKGTKYHGATIYPMAEAGTNMSLLDDFTLIFGDKA